MEGVGEGGGEGEDKGWVNSGWIILFNLRGSCLVKSAAVFAVDVPLL